MRHSVYYDGRTCRRKCELTTLYIAQTDSLCLQCVSPIFITESEKIFKTYTPGPECLRYSKQSSLFPCGKPSDTVP